jgi:TP901 family phage tail tape measure protein
MSNRDLSIGLKLYADAARFVSGLTQAEGRVHRFGGAVKREFDAFKGAMGSVEGKLASIGVSVGVVSKIMQSARMDKSLMQIGQTAGVSRAEVAGLRRELFTMSEYTGQNVDDLQVGFNNAVQSGLNFREALPVIGGVNTAVAVTGANAERLTAGLTVAGQAFQFDLSKPGLAVELLDKMTVAGRQGNAELENLSDIFARVGVNASGAGMGFDKTLAFIETLSLIERQPERLATLADSTLRLFTNQKYMKDAAKATGVKFFDASGTRRDAVEVLKDIKKQYDKLTTDQARAGFLQKAFGHADLDTIKGLKTLLGGDSLTKMDEFSKQIAGAGGTLKKDLPEAIANSVDQVGRMRNALRHAADDFAQPINETLQNVIRWGMDKNNGGLGINGKEALLGGGALALGTLAAARYGSKGISSLAKRFGGTAAGVAEGKALEAAAGVTPVYVVNFPASLGGGAADIAGAAANAAGGAGKVAGKAKTLAAMVGSLPIGALGTMGAGGLATIGAGVAAAGAGGYAVGSGLNWLGEKAAKGTRLEGAGTDIIGGAIAKTLAFFGNEEARRAVEMTKKLEDAKVGGEITLRVLSDGSASVVSSKSANKDVPINVHTGRTMVTG